tara:strand:+ start:1381 stop:2022 length:642 start_codon:yes stop_codon:yes gene_type:complete
MQPRISVKQVVAAVIRNLDVQDAAREFNTFVEWAFEAEKKIGTFKTFVNKEVTLSITNKQAALPTDLIEVIDVKNSNDIYYQPQIKSFKTSNSQDLNYKYYLSSGFIQFSIVPDSEIQISYIALETDDDGYPTIEANHEDAVSHYIMYKYKARDYYNQKLPRFIYMDMKQEWNRLCAQARGNDNMPNKNQMRNIYKIWNSLIPIHSGYSNLDI